MGARWLAVWAAAAEVRQPDVDQSLLQLKHIQEDMLERNRTAAEKYAAVTALLHAADALQVPTAPPGALGNAPEDDAQSDEDARMVALVDAQADGPPEPTRDPMRSDQPARFLDEDEEVEVDDRTEAERRGLFVPSSLAELGAPWRRVPSPTLRALRERSRDQRRAAHEAEAKLAAEAEDAEPESLLQARREAPGAAEAEARAAQYLGRAEERLDTAAAAGEERQAMLRQDPSLGPIVKRFDADQEEFEEDEARKHRAASLLQIEPLAKRKGKRGAADLGRVHANLQALQRYFHGVHQRFEAAPPASLAQVGARHRAGGQAEYQPEEVQRLLQPASEPQMSPMREMDEMRKEWRAASAHFRAEEDEVSNRDPPPALIDADEQLTRARAQDRAQVAQAREQLRMNVVKDLSEKSEQPFGWRPESLLQETPLAAEKADVQRGLDKLAARMRHAEQTIAEPGTLSQLDRLAEAKAAPEADPLAAMLSAQTSHPSGQRAAALESDSAKLLASWAKQPTSLAELSPALHKFEAALSKRRGGTSKSHDVGRQAEETEKFGEDKQHLQEHMDAIKRRANAHEEVPEAEEPELTPQQLGHADPFEYGVDHDLPKAIAHLQNLINHPAYLDDPLYKKYGKK